MMEDMFCFQWLLAIINDIFTGQNFKAWDLVYFFINVIDYPVEG
jgi:hypothetical protein